MIRRLAHATWALLATLASPAFAEWSGDVTIPLPICTADRRQSPALAVPDGTDGAIVVWHDDRLVNPGIYAQRVSGSGALLWTSNGVPVSGDPASTLEPNATTDGAGGAIVAWVDYRGWGDVYAQRIGPDGTSLWTTGGVLVGPYVACCNVTHQVVPDGASGAIFIWFSDSASVLLARRLDAAGAVVWTATLGPYGAGNLEVASDGLGGALVAWDGHVQRVTHDGALLWGPGGASGPWADGPSYESYSLCGDGAGGGWISWVGPANDIYVRRLHSGGAPLWTTSFSTPSSSLPVVVPSGEDVIVGWTGDPVPGLIIKKVLTQCLDAVGAPRWTPGTGVLLADSVTVDGFSGVPDGAGGALFTWSAGPVQANRVDVSGTTWPRRVTVGPGFGNSVAAVPDGGHGALVAWSRGLTSADILGQRILGNGQLADTPVPTLWALATSEVSADEVRLEWQAPDGSGEEIEIQRAPFGGGWTGLARTTADAGGRVAFDDRDVVAGMRYGYRLAHPATGTPIATSEHWVTVPERLELSLRTLANPTTGAIAATITLPRASRVDVGLIDVNGRRVARQELDLAAGTHRVSLGSTRDRAPGVYLLELRAGGASRTARVCVVR